MEIEKDIPIPGKRRGISAEFKTIISKMTNMDSVLCESKKDALAFSSALRSSGYKIKSRQEGEKVRVWMIAEPEGAKNQEGKSLQPTTAQSTPCL